MVKIQRAKYTYVCFSLRSMIEVFLVIVDQFGRTRGVRASGITTLDEHKIVIRILLMIVWGGGKMKERWVKEKPEVGRDCQEGNPNFPQNRQSPQKSASLTPPPPPPTPLSFNSCFTS